MEKDPDFSTFGASRNAYNKVVGSTTRNIGQQFDPTLPGPGDYHPKPSYELNPAAGVLVGTTHKEASQLVKMINEITHGYEGHKTTVTVTPKS